MKNVLNVFLLLLFTGSAGAQNGWNVLTTNTTLNLLDVQAYSADTIFIAGDDGILLKSFNGGGTFTTYQNFSQPIYTAVHFRTADTGFVGSGSGFVLTSANGGQNFTPSGNCTCFISDICFSNASIGLYSGLTGLYRSTNGGISFSSTPLATLAPRKMEAPADSVFVGYKNGIILKSTDYGQTFSRDTITNAVICGLHFFNPQQGYTLTADGYLYYTGDQGSTWSFVYNSPLTNIQCMTFLDSLTGYLIEGPMRNHIYKTINGGQTWNLDYTSTSAMEAIDTKGNVVYISGQQGLALKNDSYTGIHTPGERTNAKLFPNPVSSGSAEVTLQLPGAIPGTVYTITDLSGRVVHTGMLTGATTTIRTGDLAAGMYVVRPGAGSYAGVKLVKE